jgi:hypothetical protein
MRFSAQKINFARKPISEDDEGSDLPKPKLLKLQRRRAGVQSRVARSLRGFFEEAWREQYTTCHFGYGLGVETFGMNLSPDAAQMEHA